MRKTRPPEVRAKLTSLHLRMAVSLAPRLEVSARSRPALPIGNRRTVFKRVNGHLVMNTTARHTAGPPLRRVKVCAGNLGSSALMVRRLSGWFAAWPEKHRPPAPRIRGCKGDDISKRYMAMSLFPGQYCDNVIGEVRSIVHSEITLDEESRVLLRQPRTWGGAALRCPVRAAPSRLSAARD
jgi:hypothetical protein